MTTRDDALIAAVLGDAEPSPQLARWLATASGRRELAAYRRTLAALQRRYGEVRVPPAGRVVYYCSLPSPIGRVLAAASETGLVRV